MSPNSLLCPSAILEPGFGYSRGESFLTAATFYFSNYADNLSRGEESVYSEGSKSS